MERKNESAHHDEEQIKNEKNECLLSHATQANKFENQCQSQLHGNMLLAPHRQCSEKLRCKRIGDYSVFFLPYFQSNQMEGQTARSVSITDHVATEL